MAGLIGIGLTGILSQQSALNTTANNITNANTPGYSRQEVVFETQQGQRTGAGTIGKGVSVVDIRRLANEYLVQQVREDSTLTGEQQALNSELNRLDNLLGGESTGLNNALNNFFASLQNAAEDPASLPQRQLVLSEAQQVVNRFQALSQEFIQQRESVKTQMQQGVKDANTLLKSIADLNLAISESPGLAQGRMPNELLDQRDEKLRQLAELVNIRVTETEGSQVNVSLSNGLSLVVGNNAAQFGTRDNAEDPTRLEFTLTNGGRTLNIDEQISGGKLGGLRRFDNEALKPAFDELGRIAIGVAASMNDQHEIGMDLEGDLGGLFFNDVNDLAVQRSRVVANANNQLPRDGQLAVEITDSTKLPAGSWTLQFSGDGRNFELIDKASGKIVNQGRLPDPVQSEITMPGFNIRVEGGTFNAGDKYLIQPSRNAAESIGLQVNREEDLAFASPIRATTGDQNVGTGKIDQGTMLNVRSPFTGSLLPGFQTAGELANGPLTISFAAGGPTGMTFTVTGPPPASATVGTANQPYEAGKINTVFSNDPAAGADYQGFQFKLTGQPATGDTFEIAYNSNGVSDNRNAELLAALGTANTLNGKSQSFTEGYAGLVEDIGVKTRQSQFDLEAGKTLLEQSTGQRESVSGVNLDEEAGRLIQYQAAYNASAQVISVAQDLFNTLLQTFR
ncbi:MAG: flagellar hook-associated protein FlgK [Marinobacter sp.]|uniref:flagellar hook-associated protein FlgK n=1 Tax=Marinobacter sp. TaxID=50741 RepID=UPI001B5060BC|nr:flagellar hook-associated protein FlgK [Marinobacter sp.]MBQ0748442.1 flagellar hook-associated protein FlgK [Marinobacter sp.]MBQ0815824.1 flagellar hook-associated protein FlgK [Marinobacter sp.]|tara:strand:+ start:3737 stop:5776 length:2040 start_codon:yes stop_codon:yes gene_type:complete